MPGRLDKAPEIGAGNGRGGGIGERVEIDRVTGQKRCIDNEADLSGRA